MRLWVLAAVLLACGARTVDAQDLVARLQQARLERIAAENQHFKLSLKELAPLGLRGDSLRGYLMAIYAPPEPEPPPPPKLSIETLTAVAAEDSAQFAAWLQGPDWAFVRSRGLTELDTLRTSELRARLQAVVGDPTRTLAELDSVETLQREAIIQFEYWLMANDSLPLVLIDVNGPLERGLVLATRAAPQHELADLHEALRRYLFLREERAPYADYFYQIDTGWWIVSGFDGATFFERRIEPPDLSAGRPDLSIYVSGPPER